MKSFFIVLSIAMLQAGCTTTAHYKQSTPGNKFGYTDSKITERSYRVVYTHNNSTRAYDGFMRRAAELTVASGQKYFSAKEVNTGQKTTYVGLIAVPFTETQGTVFFEEKKSAENFDATEVLANLSKKDPSVCSARGCT